MGQTGQYNYRRCISRGDTAAAQLTVGEFVKSTLNAVFLLNKTYAPYYKWSFRALSEQAVLSSLYGPLEYLISSPNGERDAKEKEAVIEKICSDVISELREQQLTRFPHSEAEGHAYSVNDRISDHEIRNLHVLYAV